MPGRMRRYVAAEVRLLGTELDRLRRDAPRTSVPVAAAATAAVVAYGNGVVWAGRRYGHREWITLVAVPALGAAGAIALRVRGWSAADMGIARPALPDRRLPRTLLFAGAVVVTGLAARVLLVGDGTRRLELARLVVGTAIGEELVHRGVVLALWSSAPVSRRVALAANVTAFGLWHVVGATKPDGFQPLDVLVPALVGGPLFLWARLRFRSVAAPATFHGATNIWGV